MDCVLLNVWYVENVCSCELYLGPSVEFIGLKVAVSDS